MAILLLSELKAHLGIPTAETSQDDVLNDIINGATAEIENICGKIEDDDYTEKMIFDDGIAFAQNKPINSITSITDDDDYTYDEDTTALQLRSGLIALETSITDELTVAYNAGYVTVPYDVKLYAIRLSEYYYYKKAGTTSESLEGFSVKYQRPDINLLNPYKKMVG